jgi:hypothetical protein
MPLLASRAAGPLAGAVVAVIVLAVGIALSPSKICLCARPVFESEGNSMLYAGLKWIFTASICLREIAT